MEKGEGSLIRVIPDETIIRKIYVLRSEKVMLDKDLAELYEVGTKVLNQAENILNSKTA